MVGQHRDLAPEPGVLELLDEAERGDAGEADENGVDVASELADVGRLVRRAQRRPELLDDLATGVLEGLVEARHHLVAEGEVVGDGRDLRVAQRLRGVGAEGLGGLARGRGDRKSTRLNSSHGYISYAVFCLKKKKEHKNLAEGKT